MLRLCLILAVIWAAVGCSAHTGTVSLINRSSQTIAHASVSISGQHFAWEKIAPGERAEFTYRIGSDSHFVVEVRFASGATVRQEGGYVTNGAHFAHEILVTDGGVDIVLLSTS